LGCLLTKEVAIAKVSNAGVKGDSMKHVLRKTMGLTKLEWDETLKKTIKGNKERTSSKAKKKTHRFDEKVQR